MAGALDLSSFNGVLGVTVLLGGRLRGLRERVIFIQRKQVSHESFCFIRWDNFIAGLRSIWANETRDGFIGWLAHDFPHFVEIAVGWHR